MNQKKSKSGGESPGTLKVFLALAVICGAAWFGWSTYAKYNPKPAPPTDGLMMGPPTPAQRTAMMKEMMDQVKLSDDQKKQMEALWAKGEPQNRDEWRERVDAMRKITTPEQQQQFRQIMTSRMTQRMEKARQMMSPPEFDAFQKRVQARMQGRGGGRGGGMGFPGGGRQGGGRQGGGRGGGR